MNIYIIFMFTSEPRLTAPEPGVGHLAGKARRVVSAADQGVGQIVVAVNNADAVHTRS